MEIVNASAMGQEYKKLDGYCGSVPTAERVGTPGLRQSRAGEDRAVAELIYQRPCAEPISLSDS